MKNILFAVICLTLSVVAQAQTEKPKETTQMPNAETRRAEMKKLDALVGQWSGTGWIQREQGKENFSGTETVQRKVGGLALLVEGNFKDKDGAVIHETLAVLSPNSKTKNYDFRTYLASGLSGEHEFKTTEQGWQWGFTFSIGTVRYDIRIENERWIETGEISRDSGKTWMKIFEMNLKKVK